MANLKLKPIKYWKQQKLEKLNLIKTMVNLK